MPKTEAKRKAAAPVSPSATKNKVAAMGKPQASRKKKAISEDMPIAKRADPHICYQLSVQNTEHEVDMLSKTFKRYRKRKALSLKEDFCGTAILCADWVKSDPKRSATGLDIDASVLRWGIEHNMSVINEPGNRVKLLQQNVLDSTGERFDIVVGFNFSYWLFEKRAQMKRYLSTAYEQLEDDGMLFLDFYGGWEAQEPMEEPREISVPKHLRKAEEPGPDATLEERFNWEAGLVGVKKFTYVWDQNTFNPITNSAMNYIHFRFNDGSSLERAFSYSWRLWNVVEIRELLDEVGFARTEVLWEESDEEDEGTGEFSPAKKVDNDPGWLAYIVALK